MKTNYNITPRPTDQNRPVVLFLLEEDIRVERAAGEFLCEGVDRLTGVSLFAGLFSRLARMMASKVFKFDSCSDTTVCSKTLNRCDTTLKWFSKTLVD